MTAPARWAWGAALVVLVGLGVLLAVGRPAPIERYGLVDFYDYYFAAHAVVHGDDPYDSALADERATAVGAPTLPGSHYVYAPWFAAILAPLTAWSAHTAGLLWYGLGALALLSALHELARWSGGRWGPLIGVLFPGSLVALFVGQVNPIVLALLVSAWRWREHRPALAGGALGLVVAVKLTPILLLAPCVRWRRWRLLIGVAAAVAVCTVVGELAVPGGTWRYISSVAPGAGEMRSDLAHPSNQGVAGTVLRTLAPNVWTTPPVAAPHAVWPAVAALSLLVLLAFAWQVRRARDERATWAIAITAMVLVSPLAWEALFVLLLFPLAVLATTRPRLAGGCIALTIAQRAMDDFAHAPGDHPWLQSVPLLASLGAIAATLLYVSLLRAGGGRAC